MTMAPTYDVAIVGFGPSGAVAAALCAQAGLRTYVCDKATEVYDKPRAIALDHEIMRVFQQLGLAEAVLPWVEPFTPSEYFGVDGQLIKRMTMVAPPYPLGHVPSMVFSQPPVERVLREHVAAQPGVTVELGRTLKLMAQDDDGVTLMLERAPGPAPVAVGGKISKEAEPHSRMGDDDGQGPEPGASQTVRARWLIGCDGASSTVRTLLGTPLDDLDFDEPWLVVDVLVNERGLAKLPATSVQYCEPERPCTMVIGTKNHRRWEISLKPGEDLQQVVQPEATWALLARWLTPEDGSLWRQASYRFHALVATRWRNGRIFIAGDAAHQQPPFLGQGMCQGVRDVANLVWKLSAIVHGEVKGEAAEALLDSYGTERQAHVRELTRRIKAIGAVICERDAAKARARDTALLAECGGVVKDTPRQDVLPRLEAGCLSQHQHSARGTIFPQPRLLAGGAGSAGSVAMDNHVGRGWLLVVDDTLAKHAPLSPGLRRLHLGPHGHTETDGVVAAWLHRHACHAALVRPDHAVFGIAATAAELDALLLEHAAAMGRPAPFASPPPAAGGGAEPPLPTAGASHGNDRRRPA